MAAAVAPPRRQQMLVSLLKATPRGRSEACFGEGTEMDFPWNLDRRALGRADAPNRPTLRV